MPTTVTIPAAAYADAPIQARITEGLVGYYNFGGTMPTSIVNHAGGPDLGVNGSPVLATGYASCKSLSNFFETYLPETSAHTVGVLCRTMDTLADNAHTPVFVGNYNVGAPQGFSLNANGAPTARMRQSATLTDGSTLSANLAQFVVSDPTKWRILVGRYQPGVGGYLNDLTDNLSVFVPSTLARSLRPSTLLVGSSTGTLTGTCDIAAVQIYARYQSDPEMNAGIGLDLRMLGTEKGITA